MDHYRGLSVGNIIDCEGGSIVVPAEDYSSARAFDSRGRLLREFKGVGNHYQSFIRAVRSRKATDLAAPIVEGQVSSALSHLGNVSQRVGRDGRASEVNGQLAAEPLLTEAFARMSEHLKRNGVDLERTPVRLGASLDFDQVAQRIVGVHASAANRLLSREYRPPFVVPNLESPRPAGG